MNEERSRAAVSGSRMMHGGYAAAEPLDASTRMIVEAFIDTLIPPEEEWPDAAALGIVELLERYLVPAGAPVSLYPGFSGVEFSSLMQRIAAALPTGTVTERVELVREIETNESALFARLRDFVYYIYYGHPAVVKLIRATTRHGSDYLGGSQPVGYLRVLESWGSRSLTHRGVFIPTDAVTRAPQARKENA